MSVHEELSILDLLKVQVPGCIGCLPHCAPAKSASDAEPILNDILTFVRALIPGEAKDECTLPNHPDPSRAPQMFFGISLAKEAESGVEQLTCFIQSQVNPQLHSCGPKKPPRTPQHHSVHSAVTTQSLTPSSSIQHLSDNPQHPLVNCNNRQSVPPSTYLDQPILKTPIHRKVHHSPNTPKSYPYLSSHEQTQSVSLQSQILELELHPSPSHFFRETQKEKLSTTGFSPKCSELLQIDISDVSQLGVANNNKPKSSATENQGIHSCSDYIESQGEHDDSYSKRSQEANSPTLPENQSVKEKNEYQVKADLDSRRDEVSVDPDPIRDKEKGFASPSKGKRHMKPGQGSSKDQVMDGTCSSKDQIKNSKSFSKGQVKNGTDSSKVQEGKTGQCYSRGQVLKVGQSFSKGRAKCSPTSNKDQEVKARVDSSRDQEVTDGTSSSKTLEVKVVQSSSKGQAKDCPTSCKSQEVKSSSSSRKDSHTKAGPSSHKDQQVTGSSESSRGQENKLYKLPFISTDELENQDNEDPRWKKQARLSTDEERYKLARKLWKNPCVPDPNRNLTIFGTTQLKTLHFLSSAGSRKRQRKQWYDMEDLQPSRKRQRRFENVAFSTNHIERSKYLVMNEFLDNLQLPNVSRQAAKKMENSHKEKQYMLDLALEEVKAIQQFYDGLPNQDLTVTQEEVERGWEATEHVYQIFGHIYGYSGQEFFP